MFLILFCNIFKAELVSIFSKNRIFIQLKSIFCQLSNMASSGLQKMLTFVILCEMFWKMLFFAIFNTVMCVDCFLMVCLMTIIIVDKCCVYYCGRCSQDVLSSSQQTKHGPSLANGAHPVSARHPGGSFPVHHPQEAVPKLTNDDLFPSLPWSTPFHGT